MADNKDKKVLNVPALRFPEFTGEWKFVHLKDVAEFQKKRISSDLLNNNNYISTENILQNFEGIQYSSSIPTNTNVIEYQKGDILLSNIRPYLKKVWFSDRKGGCSADVFVLRGDKCDQHFLYYVIASDRFINYVMSGVKGVKMPRGDKSQMEKYAFSIPTNTEQRKIAKFLSMLDERIKLQNKIIEDLRLLRDAIMVEHYRKCNKSELYIYDIGEPFNVMNLSKDDLTKDGSPCIIYGELFTTYGCVIENVVSHTTKSPNSTLSTKGDLLFPASTTVDALSLIAPSSINEDGIILGGDMFGIHVNEQYNSNYLSYYFNIIGKKNLAKFAKGSTIIHLHYADIQKAKITLPNKNEQETVANLLLKVEHKLNIEQKMLINYLNTKNFLLRQMFI